MQSTTMHEPNWQQCLYNLIDNLQHNEKFNAMEIQTTLMVRFNVNRDVVRDWLGAYVHSKSLQQQDLGHGTTLPVRSH